MRFRRGRPPRVLLAWEYGGGYTHAVNLRAVAAHLRARGVACLAALHDPRAAPDLPALGVPVLQNHVWPHARRFDAHRRERPYAGFPDLLGNLGFADADAVAAGIAHYDALFALAAPDLVLAENAYGAHLAARGRMPVLAFGFGQFLPPVAGGAIAAPEHGPPAWGEGEILEGLNAGLARAGRPPLARLADLFCVDGVLPFGPAAFDRFTPWRAVPALAAHVPGFVPGARAGAGAEVFAYLRGAVPEGVDPADLLPRLPGRVRAHLPDLTGGERARLAAAGVVLEAAPVPVADLVARSRLVLHHGGVGLAAACLAAGLPQVVLSGQIDQSASGAFVAREGLGAHLSLAGATVGDVVEIVRRVGGDADLCARCLARAPEFEAWCAPDPTLRVADEAMRLLGR